LGANAIKWSLLQILGRKDAIAISSAKVLDNAPNQIGPFISSYD
jgi:hypothetical protein